MPTPLARDPDRKTAVSEAAVQRLVRTNAALRIAQTVQDIPLPAVSAGASTWGLVPSLTAVTTRRVRPDRVAHKVMVGSRVKVGSGVKVGNRGVDVIRTRDASRIQEEIQHRELGRELVTLLPVRHWQMIRQQFTIIRIHFGPQQGARIHQHSHLLQHSHRRRMNPARGPAAEVEMRDDEVGGIEIRSADATPTFRQATHQKAALLIHRVTVSPMTVRSKIRIGRDVSRRTTIARFVTSQAKPSVRSATHQENLDPAKENAVAIVAGDAVVPVLVNGHPAARQATTFRRTGRAQISRMVPWSES